MKNKLSIIGIVAFGLLATQTSCDKVENPNVIITDLDTNLFPGAFVDYVFPTFEANPNAGRNAVVADYTGHQCTFCPPAAEKAKEIAEANPGRVFVASIHASAEPGGTGTFQNVDDVFTRDLTNAQGREMGSVFAQASVGFGGNPRGTVNRVEDEEGEFFFFFGEWAEEADAVLASDLQVNLQAKSNYYPGTKGAFIHVETEFLADLEGDFNIVVYAIEDEYIGPQKFPGAVIDYEYKHHDIHIGNVFDETWGRNVANGSIASGTKFQTDFSYEVPDGLNPDNMHFLVVVFNRDSYEILQVIKHEI